MHLNPNIVLRVEFDQWGILFNPDDGSTRSLNPVGVLVWQGLEKGNTLEEIMDEIRNQCQEVPDTLEADCKEFLQSLINGGYLSED